MMLQKTKSTENGLADQIIVSNVAVGPLVSGKRKIR